MSAARGVLHVAALPFPSPQGTQAALRAMLDAEAGAERPTALLSYAHGAGGEAGAWPHHRTSGIFRDRSLRSRPSLKKAAQDLELAARLRIIADGRPVVAHHVEAASAALMSGARRWVFVAHTDLHEELPFYFPSWLQSAAREIGGRLDRHLVRRAPGVGAISPALRDQLQRHSDSSVRYLPVPWRVSDTGLQRERARHALGLSFDDHLVLYAGNLDRYQGMRLLVGAFHRAARRDLRLRWLIATESSPAELRRHFTEPGLLARVYFRPLATERDRALAHSAADLSWVHRAAVGGVPIKMLDSLARGVLPIVSRRASAGLSLRGAVCVDDPNPEAWAAATLEALNWPVWRRAAADSGRRYLRSAHSDRAYLNAIDQLLAENQFGV